MAKVNFKQLKTMLCSAEFDVLIYFVVLIVMYYILGEMIEKLTLTFNRTRQAVITRELIEIISGAAALD